jgi:multiple antibiotic resistance protein
MSISAYILLTISSLLAIVNPLAALPSFFGMTPNDDENSRLRMARTACMTCAGVLASFALAGNSIFHIFGITLAAFQMAGGLVLLLVSLDNLRARRSSVNHTEEEMQEGVGKSDISITPLAIPMLSGPGAITTAILLESKAQSILYQLVLFCAIGLVATIAYFVFYISIKKAGKVSPTAMNIVTRIMGLILAATAVQFMIDGIRSAFMK